MEINGRLKHIKTTEVDEPFLVEAIHDYALTANFPRKLELKRIKATTAYYDEKVKQHNRVIEQAQGEIDRIGQISGSVRSKCFTLLNNLKQVIV